MTTIREALAKMRAKNTSVQLPDAKFGSGDRVCDWRKLPPDQSLDDDVELPTAPPELVDLLGFDPKEWNGKVG